MNNVSNGDSNSTSFLHNHISKRKRLQKPLKHDSDESPDIEKILKSSMVENGSCKTDSEHNKVTEPVKPCRRSERRIIPSSLWDNAVINPFFERKKRKLFKPKQSTSPSEKKLDSESTPKIYPVLINEDSSSSIIENNIPHDNNSPDESSGPLSEDFDKEELVDGHIRVRRSSRKHSSSVSSITDVKYGIKESSAELISLDPDIPKSEIVKSDLDVKELVNNVNAMIDNHVASIKERAASTEQSSEIILKPGDSPPITPEKVDSCKISPQKVLTTIESKVFERNKSKDQNGTNICRGKSRHVSTDDDKPKLVLEKTRRRTSRQVSSEDEKPVIIEKVRKKPGRKKRRPLTVELSDEDKPVISNGSVHIGGCESMRKSPVLSKRDKAAKFQVSKVDPSPLKIDTFQDNGDAHSIESTDDEITISKEALALIESTSSSAFSPLSKTRNRQHNLAKAASLPAGDYFAVKLSKKE